MQRFLIGGIVALLLAGGAALIYAGTSQPQDPAEEALPPPPPPGAPIELPKGDPSARGAPPPALPVAREMSREERRFGRYDRNRDGTITRIEMLSTRSTAFRRLDTDGNNLLSFEEWAVATGDRFVGADRDRSGGLSSAEFATTAPPERERRSNCRC